MLKRTSCSLIALVACTGLASAADLNGPSYGGSLKDDYAASAAHMWTGAYVGGHLGYAWGKSSSIDLQGWNFPGLSVSFKPEGSLGGAYAGYNRQSDRFVVGFEVEVGYLNLDKSAMFRDPFNYNDTFASTDGGFYGGLSGRLGYVLGQQTMIYAKAGAVYSGGKYRVEDNCNTDPCGSLLLAGSKTIGFGYQIGGGVEHAFTDHWVGRLEYAYLHFGDSKVTGVDLGVGNTIPFDADLSAQTIKIGLSYKY